MLYALPNIRWNSTDVDILDTDDWSVESISKEQYESIKERLGIIKPNCDVARDDSIIVFYSINNTGYKYILQYKIVKVDVGVILVNSESFEFYPDISVWNGVVRFSYEDKHYYEEDKGLEFEREWVIRGDWVDKGAYGDRFKKFRP